MCTCIVRSIQSDDGSSSFSTATSYPSSVIESENMVVERNINDEMVTVNKNCVNFDSNANYFNDIDLQMLLKHDENIINNIHTHNIHEKNNNYYYNYNNNEKEIVSTIVNSAAADALVELDRELNFGFSSPLIAIEKSQINRKDENLNIIENNCNDDSKNITIGDDDGALARSSSNYSDVFITRSDMSSTSALSHVAHYTPTLDNNRNHHKAVRKNFSLWIGVTSCVWACLVWLMKNYT